MNLLLHQLLGPQSKTSDEPSPRPSPQEPRRLASLERETSLRVQDLGPDRDGKSRGKDAMHEYTCLTKAATPQPASFETTSVPTSPAVFNTAFDTNVSTEPDMRQVDPDIPDLEVDDDTAPVITIRSDTLYAPNNPAPRLKTVLSRGETTPGLIQFYDDDLLVFHRDSPMRIESTVTLLLEHLQQLGIIAPAAQDPKPLDTLTSFIIMIIIKAG
jgi:hypothetical protein